MVVKFTTGRKLKEIFNDDEIIILHIMHNSIFFCMFMLSLSLSLSVLTEQLVEKLSFAQTFN